MTKRIIAFTAVVLLLLGAATAAQAAKPDRGNSHNGFSSSEVSAQIECEELYGICLYDNDSYLGDWYFLNVPTYISNFCVNLSGTGFNNRTNAVTMNGPSSGGLKSSVRLWNRPDCEIGTRLDPPGKLYSPWLNTTMNNDITSSVRITVEAA